MHSLSNLISGIVNERRENLYNSDKIANLYLNTFLSVLGQCVNCAPKYNTNHPLFSMLNSTRNYLLKNFQSNPDIDQVAKSIGLSQYYFRRVYKEIFGVTPHSDIIEARINH
ncbi:MAG: helix-turn-helix transcriptional regulator, partial [Alphaproteobacteria bacterium]